jgi:hypothetical protein
MEVSVATGDLDSVLDRGFRCAILASLDRHHGFHAGNHPTIVFRIVCEVSLNREMPRTERDIFFLPVEPPLEQEEED